MCIEFSMQALTLPHPEFRCQAFIMLTAMAQKLTSEDGEETLRKNAH